MTRDGSTRRRYLTLTGAIATGGLLAGCSENAGSNATEAATDTATDTPESTATATETTEADDETTTDQSTTDGSYTVEMAPMGEVTFESVPESIFTRLTHEAGMAFALGRGDDVNAMHAPDYYDSLWNQFTPRLPGVELDWTGLYSSWNPSKEKLYELDSDVHLADPAGIDALDGWDRSDVEEIATGVSPWFGNYYSYANAEVPGEWEQEYEYYDLWELFRRTAQVFQEGERYEALKAVYDDIVTQVQSDLPSETERTTATMALLSDLDDIWMYKVNATGYAAAHTRPCQAIEAFGDDVDSGANVDMEALLEADPDVLFALGGMHPGTDMAGIRQSLEDHSVGSALSAVQNDRVHAQGARFQGPIVNLFQIEMTAKQLYPDRFGEWPTYVEGPYPEIPAEEQLFDRQRVADIINGDF